MLYLSSAPTWTWCSASPGLSARLPKRGATAQQREGVQAHTVAETLVRTGEVMAGPEYTDEMTQGAWLLADRLLGAMREHPGGEKLIEHSVDPGLPFVQPGRLDVAYVCDGGLYVWDYKFGHSATEAEGNEQLAGYLHALALQYRIPVDTPFTAEIVQPRAYRGEQVSTWAGTLADLHPHVSRISDAAKLAAGPNAHPVTGAHCRRCDAKAYCSALRDDARGLGAHIAEPPALDELQPEQLGDEYTYLSGLLPAIKSRLEAVAEAVEAAGAASGYVSETVQGSPKWAADDETIRAVARALGGDADKPGLITPTQFYNCLPPALRDAARQATAPLVSRKTTSVLKPVADSDIIKLFED